MAQDSASSGGSWTASSAPKAPQSHTNLDLDRYLADTQKHMAEWVATACFSNEDYTAHDSSVESSGSNLPPIQEEAESPARQGHSQSSSPFSPPKPGQKLSLDLPRTIPMSESADVSDSFPNSALSDSSERPHIKRGKSGPRIPAVNPFAIRSARNSLDLPHGVNGPINSSMDSGSQLSKIDTRLRTFPGWEESSEHKRENSDETLVADSDICSAYEFLSTASPIAHLPTPDPDDFTEIPRLGFPEPPTNSLAKRGDYLREQEAARRRAKSMKRLSSLYRFSSSSGRPRSNSASGTSSFDILTQPFVLPPIVTQPAIQKNPYTPAYSIEEWLSYQNNARVVSPTQESIPRFQAEAESNGANTNLPPTSSVAEWNKGPLFNAKDATITTSAVTTSNTRPQPQSPRSVAPTKAQKETNAKANLTEVLLDYTMTVNRLREPMLEHQRAVLRPSKSALLPRPATPVSRAATAVNGTSSPGSVKSIPSVKATSITEEHPMPYAKDAGLVKEHAALMERFRPRKKSIRKAAPLSPVAAKSVASAPASDEKLVQEHTNLMETPKSPSMEAHREPAASPPETAKNLAPPIGGKDAELLKEHAVLMESVKRPSMETTKQPATPSRAPVESLVPTSDGKDATLVEEHTALMEKLRRPSLETTQKAAPFSPVSTKGAAPDGDGKVAKLVEEHTALIEKVRRPSSETTPGTAPSLKVPTTASDAKDEKLVKEHGALMEKLKRPSLETTPPNAAPLEAPKSAAAASNAKDRKLPTTASDAKDEKLVKEHGALMEKLKRPTLETTPPNAAPLEAPKSAAAASNAKDQKLVIEHAALVEKLNQPEAQRTTDEAQMSPMPLGSKDETSTRGPGDKKLVEQHVALMKKLSEPSLGKEQLDRNLNEAEGSVMPQTDTRPAHSMRDELLVEELGAKLERLRQPVTAEVEEKSSERKIPGKPNQSMAEQRQNNFRVSVPSIVASNGRTSPKSPRDGLLVKEHAALLAGVTAPITNGKAIREAPPIKPANPQVSKAQKSTLDGHPAKDHSTTDGRLGRAGIKDDAESPKTATSSSQRKSSKSPEPPRDNNFLEDFEKRVDRLARPDMEDQRACVPASKRDREARGTASTTSASRQVPAKVDPKVTEIEDYAKAVTRLARPNMAEQRAELRTTKSTNTDNAHETADQSMKRKPSMSRLVWDKLRGKDSNKKKETADDIPPVPPIPRSASPTPPNSKIWSMKKPSSIKSSVSADARGEPNGTEESPKAVSEPPSPPRARSKSIFSRRKARGDDMSIKSKEDGESGGKPSGRPTRSPLLAASSPTTNKSDMGDLTAALGAAISDAVGVTYSEMVSPDPVLRKPKKCLTSIESVDETPVHLDPEIRKRVTIIESNDAGDLEGFEGIVATWASQPDDAHASISPKPSLESTGDKGDAAFTNVKTTLAIDDPTSHTMSYPTPGTTPPATPSRPFESDDVAEPLPPRSLSLPTTTIENIPTPITKKVTLRRNVSSAKKLATLRVALARRRSLAWTAIRPFPPPRKESLHPNVRRSLKRVRSPLLASRNGSVTSLRYGKLDAKWSSSSLPM
ncbi:uncharacterized protein EV422DRAFT_425165 [Fimicolochytrium jonesii]|uniref:uncharacterized protein n=1 Tax=Fimicolochytrium jonesii TaxID=1396493 RepID=UPI0022FE14C9|nr:uncharacterized protein EV422DRAFT_425165 [Fimicolochytrium jonesii]KAI8821637.1 hypothetical protein EV422DRAFT_425165 [Fimicolochytrium jonesii]